MNGNAKWVFTIVAGVIILIVAGWLINTSAEVKITSTEVAVLKSQFLQIKDDMSEIKVVMKDIRNDQIRRQKSEDH